jgi:hypothetical protein
MIGALGFLNPWLLLALGALPALWWLLRTVPPQPRTIAFPPTRMLKDLENRKQTPARTPWWLMLIRMLAAALVIAALAEPVLNPRRAAAVSGDGPLVIVVDNTWAAAAKWALRTDMISALIAEADSAGRAVIVSATAASQRAGAPKMETPKSARETAAAIRPEPFAPRRAEVVALLATALSGKTAGRIIWLADGLEHDDGKGFADGLAKLAGSSRNLSVVTPGQGEEALGLASNIGTGGKLVAEVKRAEGGTREGVVRAWSRRGQPLGEVPFRLTPGATKTEVAFDMPLELRNQVARLDIPSLKSAGAVSLLDSRSRWLRVGLVGTVSREQSQPLLAPLYYINKALSPYMELVNPKDADTATALEAALSQNASAIVMADVGKLAGASLEKLTEWTQKGGVLVRFAGPRLEQGGDELLPVSLRTGGRTLGGALSWSTPQAIAPFDTESNFAGLIIPADVQIVRQVLADPAQITAQTKVWARLKDGTPLVTAAKRGDGWLVLFHVTANSDWSNLPLSGLFVDMLRRLTALTGGAGATPSTSAAADATLNETPKGTANEATSPDVLAPVETLNGFGELRPPPPMAQAIRVADLATVRPSPEHPPGLYGPAASARAINLIEAKTMLQPLSPLPLGSSVMPYQADKARPLKPQLLTAALGLLFADIVAVVLLQMGLSWMRGGKGGGTASTTTAAALAATALLGLTAVPEARAQTAPSPKPNATAPAAKPQVTAPLARRPEDDIALKVTLKTRLAYVITGDAATDQASLQGLTGLTSVLVQRTAIEPGEPVGVKIATDELAFFPILYWPVLPSDKALEPLVLAKVDTFMKQGGLIIFDTRDFAQALPGTNGPQGPGGQALQRMIGKLDVPRLEPVPEGHVLTKSFYLVKSFPGRWDGGQMWVEAGTDADKNDPRRARRADGVTTIIITPNDLAAAWAMDSRGRAVFPVAPGGEVQRELAFRTGVNIVMYALTGNYKADQVHVPALLERLGQ